MMLTWRNSLRKQSGFVSVWVVIFLIVGIVVVLIKTLDISGTSGLSNVAQLESTQALFLAESGIERAQSKLATAGTITAVQCSMTYLGGPSFTVGSGSTQGTFTNLSAICSDGTGAEVTPGASTPCEKCVIQVRGERGKAARTLERTVLINQNEGVVCNAATATPNCTNLTANPLATPPIPPTWSLALTNPYNYASIALFHLAATRKGNPSAAGCTAASNCSLQWNMNAQNGTRSVLSMGNLYSIAANSTTATVFQTVTQTGGTAEDVAEVGVFFPALTTTSPSPVIVGAYWNDTNSGSGGTHGKDTDAAGTTNNGAGSSSGACTSPAPSTNQSCTHWCYGGDLLVYGFAGGSTTGKADKLGSVIFNSGGTSIAMTPLSHFPNTLTANAPDTLYSEIWYAANPNFSRASVPASSIVAGEKYVIETLGDTPKFDLIGGTNTIRTAFVASSPSTGTGTVTWLNPKAINASSYKGKGTAAIGASFTGIITGNTLTIISSIGAGQIISPGAIGTGDTLNGGGITGNPTVLSGPPGGGVGTYTISGSPQSVGPSTMNAASTVLNLTACTVCNFASDDPIFGTSFTISSQLGGTTGGVGTYRLAGAAATTQPSGTITTNDLGTTLYFPAASMPGAPSSNLTAPNYMLIAKLSGTGSLVSGTKVTSVDLVTVGGVDFVKSLTLSAIPSPGLENATICGGTCAFFNHTNATTAFTIGKPANTDYWSSGFACIYGANPAPELVLKPTVKTANWREVVSP